MSSTFDIKRLRSKPAPLQHSLSSGQSSSGNIRDGSGSMETLRPGDQHLVATNSRQQQESSLTTMLPDSLAMLQTSASPASCSLAKAENSNSVVASKQGGSQAGPSVSSLYNQGQQQFSSQNNSDQHNTRSDETAAWPPRNQSQRSESDSLGVLRHVNSGTSSTVTEAQQPAIHAGFDSLIHYGGANQQHIASVSSLTLESPQTPRKVRNSSLPMGTSPSVSSSPDAGRQSPPSRRPTNATAYTVFSTASSPYNHSLPLLPNQPPLPPSPRIKASVDGVMYESILPTSSSLRPIRQTSSEGMLISSPISSPSETIASPEAALSSVHDSSTGAKKERIPSNASSPTTHKKLVRKQSKGHIRRDSGTSGHIQTPSSSSAVHSRSLSLPRSSSRGSTPNGSGSGSEHDETTVATSLNQSHFLTHRPAWLDQDPNATSPPPPPSRGKAGHHYPSLYQQHNNRSLTSLSQEQLHISSQDQSFFAPFSLPSTSAFPAQTEPGTSAPPKRKASFYRRKRSQTATGIQGDQVSDSNGFPMPSPMSEIVKSMPLHDRMSHDVLHAPAPAPKRSTGAGGFLSSITRKLSHPNLKDPPHSSEISSVLAHSTSNYFGLAYAAVSTERNDTSDQRTSQSTDDSPKLASSHAPRSWRNPFQHNNQSKSEATAPSQLSAFQSVPSKEVTHSDPFSVSSTISLPGFLHRSPRKDSLSSDRSDHSSECLLD